MKKNKTILFSALALTGFLGFSLLTNFNQAIKETDEISFGGIKASIFEDRYTNDLTGETKYSNFFSYNYRYMGTGGTSVTSSTVWNNYRGETNSGDPVVVAVIDSGIDIFHEDFLTEDAQEVKLNFSNVEQYSTLHPKSCYIYDKTGNGYYTSQVVTEVGITKAYDTNIYDKYYKEYYSHGTAVSSCIASAINGVGGFGVAPKAQIMFIKMDFFFNSLDVAIRYAADNGADVINMSLGAYAENFTDGFGDAQEGESSTATALTSAINYAHSKDCVVVAAAGNELTYKKSYPACNSGVIGVGALAEKSGTKAADFSNYNSSSDTSTGNNNVDVMAPGVVYTAQVPQQAARTTSSSSAVADTTYAETQGTSFASPLTAGAVALYRAAHPGDNRTKVISELTGSCDDIGTTGWDSDFGFGRVNIEEFINVGTPVETVTVSPSSHTLTMTSENESPTVQLSASFLPNDADEEYKEGVWMSMDENVATVDDYGLVTAVSAGTTEVYFVTEKDMIDGKCDITVVDTVVRPVTGVALNQTTANVGLNKTITLTPIFYPVNATNKTVSWSSSDTSVASVNNGVVTGLKVGTSAITVKTSDGGFEASCLVTVNNLVAKSFTINRDSHGNGDSYGWLSWTSETISGHSFVYAAETSKLQFNSSKTSYYIYNDTEVPGDISSVTIYLNSSTTKTEATSWSVRTNSSSFGQVNGIPDNGTLYSAKTISTSGTKFDINGGNYFAICYEGSGASYLDSVVIEYLSAGSSTPEVPDEVSLDKTSLTLEVGDTYQLNATANGSVTYSSNNDEVASVSSSGFITAKSKGNAVITATCGDAIATCSVTVNEKVVEPDPEEPDTPSTGEAGYVLVSDVSELKIGDKVVIAASGYDKALGVTQNNNNRAAVNITKNDKTINITDEVEELTLEAGNVSNTYAFYSETYPGYLYAASSSSNYLRTETSLSNNSSFAITISNDVATLKASGTNSRNLLKYNNSSVIFGCYSSGQDNVSIYRYNEGATVDPSSITLSQNDLTLDLFNNKTATLTASISPIEANQNVTWTSSVPSVASVLEGNITALAKGTTVITATSVADNTLSASCTVTVVDTSPVLSSIEVSNTPETVPFKGQLDTSSVVVTAKYINGTNKVVNTATFTDLDTSTIGYKTVNVSYNENGITKSTSFDVFVTNKDAVREEIPGASATYSSGDFGTTSTNRFSKNNETIDINSKGYNWTFNGTFTKSEFFGNDGTKGNQLGSGNNPISTATISSSDFSSTVTQVKVNASTASSGNCSIKVLVGGTLFSPNTQTLTTTATEYTFTGSGKGKVEIVYTNNVAKAVYFKSVSVSYSSETTYSWSGDEQASSFVNYLKTFGSCASSWTNREEIVRLVNEYNYMIQESRDSSLLLDSFSDNGGYQTSAIEKMKMIVSEYNKTLQQGETSLTLILEVDSNGNALITYDGLDKHLSLFISKYIPTIAIILSISIAIAITFKIKRKTH